MTIDEHRFQLLLDLTGRSPQQLAFALTGALGGAAEHRKVELRAPWIVTDARGRVWRLTPLDAHATRVQLATPALVHADLAALQDGLRAVRLDGARADAGAKAVLLVDGAPLDARATSNLTKIFEKQQQLLARAFGLDAEATHVDARKGAPFARGALAFEIGATLHASELAAAIVLALAIVERARTARAASSKLRPFNPTSARYDFRCFLLRLGLIGDEYRAAREQLLKRLPGSSAWKNGRPKRQRARTSPRSSDRALIATQSWV